MRSSGTPDQPTTAAPGATEPADSGDDGDRDLLDADTPDTGEVGEPTEADTVDEGSHTDRSDTSDGPAESGDDGDREPAAMGERGPRRALLVPVAALVLALALLSAVLVVTRQDPAERGREASAAAATAKGTLEQILSYNFETMTKQLPANQALLTGKFKDEFGQTMTKTIVPLAQKEKTVVQARVYEVGVMSQTEDTVTVQAFVNQASTREGQKEPAIDQNRVIATLTQVGNKWLVSQLKAY
ncbi:Mce-associated membrane protein [Knoellia remsis]|uniref:Mce-associated membrane protein n=1 Tax=Knoellia remsis TaxID=407159 RepID=A0A2T0UHU9_9MICO|nr:Mce-associated membrane protein [Knoellia remsis]